MSLKTTIFYRVWIFMEFARDKDLTGLTTSSKLGAPPLDFTATGMPLLHAGLNDRPMGFADFCTPIPKSVVAPASTLGQITQAILDRRYEWFKTKAKYEAKMEERFRLAIPDAISQIANVPAETILPSHRVNVYITNQTQMRALIEGINQRYRKYLIEQASPADFSGTVALAADLCALGSVVA